MSIDESGVQLSGVLLSRFDRVFGDFVEHHPFDRHLRIEHLQEVPRDGLTLAVLISREVQLVGTLQSTLEIGNGLLLRIGNDVVRLEVVLDVNGELAERTLLQLGGKIFGFDQVADVSDGSQNLITVAQILRNRLGLCGRLDDNQLLRARHVTPLM